MSYPPIPMYGTLPIPYVTRRDGEEPPASGRAFIEVGLDVLTGQRVHRLDCPDWERDDEGWLWQPSPQVLDGKPQFKAVNSQRHRRCMDEALCQVCGQSAVTDDFLSSWLVPRRNIPSDSKREIYVNQPPVCLNCLVLAQTMCPHLRQTEWVHVFAARTESHGVVGDTYDTRGNIIFQGTVRHYEDRAPMTLARQRVLDLREWRLA